MKEREKREGEGVTGEVVAMAKEDRRTGVRC